MIHSIRNTKAGFTFTELIVTVVILAILSAIGFVVYAEYIGEVRDSARISSIETISQGLTTYTQQGNPLPLPDNATKITSGPTKTIGYQGEAGESVLKTIGYDKSGKDPKDKSHYTYYISGHKKYHQVVAFLEQGEADKSINGRQPVSYGDKLGVLIDSTSSEPVTATTVTSIDVSTSGAPTGYNVVFSDDISVPVDDSGFNSTAYANTIQNGGITPSCSVLTDKKNLVNDQDYLFSEGGVSNAPCPLTIGENLRCGIDYHAGQNYYGGLYNMPAYPNEGAFAAMKADGSITAWGDSSKGGNFTLSAEENAGFLSLSSTSQAFAAMKADGSITAWGNSSFGGTGAPTGDGYTEITGNAAAFAALHYDGSISVWGDSSLGASGSPSGTGFIKIYSSGGAFAALRDDGTVSVWGNLYGGSFNPAGSDYVHISSTFSAFATLDSDGAIEVGGPSWAGGSWAPIGNGYNSIYATSGAFTAQHGDNSIIFGGDSGVGGTGGPSSGTFTNIIANSGAFTVTSSTGSTITWGQTNRGGGVSSSYPYTHLIASFDGFAGIRSSDSGIDAWGFTNGGPVPSDTGYSELYANAYASVALKADGSIVTWGTGANGGTGGPGDTGYQVVASTDSAFAALKSDGSISAWGSASGGGTGAPTDSGYVSINGVGISTPTNCTFSR